MSPESPRNAAPMPPHPTQPANRVGFITLGCAKNEVDTDKMRARVLAAGFNLEDNPQRCDALVINTCSFITQATQEGIDTILEAAGLPHFSQGEGRIIVAGCMPARYGDQLEEGLPEVSAFIPCADEHNIVQVLTSVLQSLHSPAPTNTPTAASASTPTATPASTPTPRFLRTTQAPWAYVKIADGCSRRCSFCTIPRIKGPYRSVPAPEIMAEVDGLVAGGVREIILIAQDTGLWGYDLKRSQASQAPTPQPTPTPQDLPQLLTQLATTFPHTWFRVMYLQPQGITNALLKVMATHDNICNYLDIPLQHANQQILKDMRRSGSDQHYLKLLARIRKALPDVTLRTTLIAGYPGETRAQAAQLERFVQQAQFDYVGVFVYSQEDGTPAGERLQQVPPRTRRARAQRLRDVADQIGFQRTAQRLGMVEEVLVLGQDEDEEFQTPVPPAAPDTPVAPAVLAPNPSNSPNQPAATYTAGRAIRDTGEPETAETYTLLGRTKRQAPEVDGMVHLDKGRTGQLVSATMVDAYCYELDGKVVDGLHE